MKEVRELMNVSIGKMREYDFLVTGVKTNFQLYNTIIIKEGIAL